MSYDICGKTWNFNGKPHRCIAPQNHAILCHCDCGETSPNRKQRRAAKKVGK